LVVLSLWLRSLLHKSVHASWKGMFATLSIMFDRPLPAVLARGRDGGNVIFDYTKLG
jgi:hypothetical protein